MRKQETASPHAVTLLHEVTNALQRLKETGQSWSIFMNKIPLSQEDRSWISDILGRGSVTITSKEGVQPAEWVESGMHGLWFGVYYDSKGSPLIETLEVAFYPPYAAAQLEDIAASLETLRMRMQDVLEA